MRIGHADAAMHLHHLVGDEMPGLVRARLGKRRERGHVVRIAVDGDRARLRRRSASSSRSVNILAARCCSAWKVPITWPNCVRVLRYSSVMSKDCDAAPSISAARPARARSSVASRMSEALIDGAQHGLRTDRRHSSNSRLATPRLSTLLQLLSREARRIGRNEKQRDALRLARLAGGTCCDDKHIAPRRHRARTSSCPFSFQPLPSRVAASAVASGA